jgi:hypothetical protein
MSGRNRIFQNYHNVVIHLFIDIIFSVGKILNCVCSSVPTIATNMVTKCHNFLNIVLNNHFPKCFDSVFLRPLSCNYQTKRTSLKFLLESWFNIASINIIWFVHLIQFFLAALSLKILIIIKNHSCFLKRLNITIYVVFLKSLYCLFSIL